MPKAADRNPATSQSYRGGGGSDSVLAGREIARQPPAKTPRPRARRRCSTSAMSSSLPRLMQQPTSATWGCCAPTGAGKNRCSAARPRRGQRRGGANARRPPAAAPCLSRCRQALHAALQGANLLQQHLPPLDDDGAAASRLLGAARVRHADAHAAGLEALAGEAAALAAAAAALDGDEAALRRRFLPPRASLASVIAGDEALARGGASEAAILADVRARVGAGGGTPEGARAHAAAPPTQRTAPARTQAAEAARGQRLLRLRSGIAAAARAGPAWQPRPQPTPQAQRVDDAGSSDAGSDSDGVEAQSSEDACDEPSSGSDGTDGERAGSDGGSAPASQVLSGQASQSEVQPQLPADDLPAMLQLIRCGAGPGMRTPALRRCRRLTAAKPRTRAGSSAPGGSARHRRCRWMRCAQRSPPACRRRCSSWCCCGASRATPRASWPRARRAAPPTRTPAEPRSRRSSAPPASSPTCAPPRLPSPRQPDASRWSCVRADAVPRCPALPPPCPRAARSLL